jgi:hypothetical protein
MINFNVNIFEILHKQFGGLGIFLVVVICVIVIIALLKKRS